MARGRRDSAVNRSTRKPPGRQQHRDEQLSQSTLRSSGAALGGHRRGAARSHRSEAHALWTPGHHAPAKPRTASSPSPRASPRAPVQEQIKDIIIIRVLSVVRPLVACAACTEAREPLPRPARLLSVGRLEAEGHGQRMRAGQRAYPAWARHGGATITEDLEDRLLWPLTRNGRSSWSFYCVSEAQIDLNLLVLSRHHWQIQNGYIYRANPRIFEIRLVSSS